MKNNRWNYPESRYDIPTPVVMHYGVPETNPPEDSALEKMRQSLIAKFEQGTLDVEKKAEKIRDVASKLADAIFIASAANDEVFKLKAELMELVKS